MPTTNRQRVQGETHPKNDRVERKKVPGLPKHHPRHQAPTLRVTQDLVQTLT